MNEFQKVLIALGIVLFVTVGIATLIFLFTGFAFYGETVAVIDLTGEISDADPIFGTSVSASVMSGIFEDAADDDSVVAVVLDIDSGGGGVVETKEIARSLSELAAEKPVVARIGDIGASGAYYVATHADLIVADEDSLVGSIGVISVYSIYKDLLEEKLGINTTVIKSGRFKDIGSPYRSITPEEEARLQEIVDAVHREFLDVVVANRALSGPQTERIETGDIFLGSEALDIGLVDHTGGLEDAIDIARALADSPDAGVMHVDESEYYGAQDLLYSVGRGLGDSLTARLDPSGSVLEV